MARFHGFKGRVYLGIANAAATAEPLPFVAEWEVNFPTDKVDVTCIDDDGKVYVSGHPDQSGMFSGFMDDATAQTYTAAFDGQARKFYLYPDRLNAVTKYFWGTIVADASFGGSSTGAVTMKSEWAAATRINRVGV